MITEKKKRVLLAWSGGLDSTYLLNQYLTKGYSVDVMYVQIVGNKDKSKREIAARKAMMKAYFKQYEVRDIGIAKVDIAGYGNRLSLKQPLLWLSMLAYAADHTHTEVAIGYVMNDCAISYLTDIQKIWKSFNGICEGKMPPLVFPLTKTSKDEMYRALPETLKPFLTWCEEAELTENCTCTPCKRMKDIVPKTEMITVRKGAKKCRVGTLQKS